MKMIQQLVIGVVAIGFLSATAARGAERISKISVNGMSCSMCAKGLQASLKSKDGVRDVQIEMASQADKPALVAVTYDDEKITEEKLRGMIREFGYEPIAAKKRR